MALQRREKISLSAERLPFAQVRLFADSPSAGDSIQGSLTVGTYCATRRREGGGCDRSRESGSTISDTQLSNGVSFDGSRKTRTFVIGKVQDVTQSRCGENFSSSLRASGGALRSYTAYSQGLFDSRHL